METILVQIPDENARKLLEQLEQMNILKLLTKRTAPANMKKKQWGGVISKESAEKMLENAEQIRQEWERGT